MDGYRIGDAGAVAVANWLAGPACRLTELSLAAGDVTAKALEFVEAERKDVGEKGGAALGKAILFNQTLHTLDLRSNSLSSVAAGRSSAAMLAFARALHVNTTLTHLDLSGNMLSHADVILLADALRRNHALTRLSLAKTRTSKEGKRVFFSFF
jgi:Ran GTPase-activating protein (RanGAP) involved in mRNA processing and transport